MKANFPIWQGYSSRDFRRLQRSVGPVNINIPLDSESFVQGGENTCDYQKAMDNFTGRYWIRSLTRPCSG